MKKYDVHLFVGPYGKQEKYDFSCSTKKEVWRFVEEHRKNEPWMLILNGGPLVHTIIDSDGVHNTITPRKRTKHD